MRTRVPAVDIVAPPLPMPQIDSQQGTPPPTQDQGLRGIDIG